MLVFSRSAIPLTIACMAILSGFPQAQVSLSGTVLNRDSTGKAGVSVTLASSREVATTNAQGAWTLGSTAGVESARTPSSTPLTRHLALVNGSQLRLSFQGFDAFGRSAGGRYVTPERLGRAAARTQNLAPDTLVSSLAGKVFLRDTLTSLVQTGIVRAFDTIPNPAITYGFLTDTRDGQIYRTVKIGTQTWMAQNLNFKGVRSWINPSGTMAPSRFYRWATVMGLDDSCNTKDCVTKVLPKHRGICPIGWHVPSDSEWTVLDNSVEADARVGDGKGGTTLKSASGWFNNGNGTDLFGFTVLPAGYRNYDGSFSGLGNTAYFWSASVEDATKAWSRSFFYSFLFVDRNFFGKTDGYSLRCTQD